MDGRRRRWFAFSADFPFDRAGTALQERFGLEGLAVWVCFLAACKRNGVQGQIRYTTDVEGWSILGIEPPSFSLDEFFSTTGDLKLTRRLKRARLTQVVATGWEDWQKTSNSRPTHLKQTPKRRQTDAKETENTGSTDSRNPWSDPQNTNKIGASDIDSDSDIDKDADIRLANILAAVRSRTGNPVSIGERVKEAELVTLLSDIQATDPVIIEAGLHDQTIAEYRNLKETT